MKLIKKLLPAVLCICMILAIVPAVSATNTSIIAVAAGEAGNLAIKSDGSVWNWSDEIPLSQVQGLANIVKVASGEVGYLALDEDGNVWFWNNDTAPEQMDAIANATDISVGSVCMALTENGEAYIFNGRVQGARNPAGWANFGAPSDPELLGAVAISAGNNGIAAVMDDGTLWTLGYYLVGYGWDTTYDITDLAGLYVRGWGNADILTLYNDGTLYSERDGEFTNGAITVAVSETMTAYYSSSNANLIHVYDDGGNYLMSVPRAFGDVKDFSCSDSELLVLRSDGSVWSAQYGENMGLDLVIPA